MAAFRKYTHEEMVKEEERINFLVRIFINYLFLIVSFVIYSMGICGFM